MEKSETMRLDASLPNSWWEFSVEHACHVYNRTPMKCLNWQTLSQVLTGIQPSVDHLRVFGYATYVHIPPETHTNKLSPKSELMTYIGVAIGQYGNCFMCSNNTVFTSATAQFDENIFPRSMQQSNMCGNKNPLPAQGGDDDHEISDLTPSSSNKRQDPRQ